MTATKTRPTPDPLPPAQLALLRAYRDEHAMPSAAKAQLLGRLAAPTASRIGPKWIAASIAVAAAVVLALGVSVLGSESANTDPSDSAADQAMRQANDARSTHEAVGRQPTGQATAAASSRATAPPVLLAPEPPSPEPPSPEPAAVAPEATTAEPLGGPSKADDTKASVRRRPQRADSPASPPAGGALPSAPTPAGPSQLSLERALLARAWSALAANNPTEAFSLSEEHRRRFASGTLSVERKAIAAIAGCNAKRGGWAEQASKFLAAHGKTPLAHRVRETCTPSAEKSPAR